MVDPTSHRAELEARNAAMREQVSSLLDGLNRQTEQLQQAQADAAAATGEATSQDGLVTVRVNAMGIVTELELTPSAFRTSTPEKLSQTLVQTIQQAATDARSKADRALAPLQQNVPDLPEVFAEAPSLKNLLPEPPTPPTATTHEDDFDDFDDEFRSPRSARNGGAW